MVANGYFAAGTKVHAYKRSMTKGLEVLDCLRTAVLVVRVDIDREFLPLGVMDISQWNVW
ncbi:MAG: hypothetical protein D3916_17365 [Candidatus Electrothrix sp. MAN1_4]|nr:hypothetical protein [Candidatus Electrothrix sp. MAN1_4]